jgi:hypothetical protein
VVISRRPRAHEIPKIIQRSLGIERDAIDQAAGKNEEEAHANSRVLQNVPIGQGQNELRMGDEDRQDSKTTESIEWRKVTGKNDAGLACQVLHIPRPGCYALSLPLEANCQRERARTCLGIGTG